MNHALVVDNQRRGSNAGVYGADHDRPGVARGVSRCNVPCWTHTVPRWTHTVMCWAHPIPCQTHPMPCWTHRINRAVPTQVCPPPITTDQASLAEYLDATCRVGHTPCRVGHTPCRFGNTPCRVGHTPCRVGHTPYRVRHTPCRVGHTPSIARCQRRCVRRRSRPTRSRSRSTPSARPGASPLRCTAKNPNFLRILVYLVIYDSG